MFGFAGLLVLVVGGEQARQALNGLGAPLAQQVRMQPVPGGDLRQGQLTLREFKRDGGLLSGRVAFANHGRKCT